MKARFSTIKSMKKWWYAVDFSLSQSIEFEVQIDKIHPLDFPLNQ